LKPEIKKLWVDALRSGEYKQGSGQLYDKTPEGERYCCLGVLCRLAQQAGLEFSVDYLDPELNHDYFGPDVAEWAGLDTDRLGDCNPVIDYEDSEEGEQELHLSELNDDVGLTFSEIADIIEEQL